MTFFFLHIVGSLFFFLGLGSLIVWAFKKWTTEEFKKYGVWMLVIGVILCIFSFAGSFRTMPGIWGSGMMMKGGWQGGPMMRGWQQGTFEQYVPSDATSSVPGQK